MLKKDPREVVKVANQMRSVARKLNKSGDPNGKIEYRGKVYNLNEGRFIEANLEIRFKPNEQ